MEENEIIEKLHKRYCKNKKLIIYLVKYAKLHGYDLKEIVNIIEEFYS